jgi:glutathione peroxidase
MTLRQNILKLIYPLLMKLGGRNGRAQYAENDSNTPPPYSFYGLQVQLNNGGNFHFDFLKGKKVLLVNTASDCGYTSQYAELQKLYDQHKDNLTIIGFPANDFKEQEKGSDEEIAQFCQKNFDLTFPLARKSTVVKSVHQHPVYQWLTHKIQNGWNEQAPVWNFSKYLVNENGILTHYFGPSVSPLSKEVISAIQR